MANVGEFGIPLTTSELELLSARVSSTEALSRLLGRYGAEHPDVWAGMYIDGARVVALLAGDVADDVRVIRRLVDPRAPLTLARARWTLAALNRLSDRILEEGWLRDNYDLLDLGVNVRRNLVELQVSSADPNAPAEIAAHYGAGEMLVVTTDGTGVTSLPTGDLAGQAVDAEGQPVAGLDVELVGSIPGSGPRGDIGLETARDGSFRFQSITATTYELRFLSHFDASGHYLEGANRILVGSASVEVRDGDTTQVTVVVERVLPAEGAQP